MSDREQWRFQWPDGTWIRWNAQTQSWEKEGQAGSAVSDPDPAGPRPEIPRGAPRTSESSAAAPPSGWQPVAARPSAPSSSPTREERPTPGASTPYLDEAMEDSEARPAAEPQPAPEPQPSRAEESRPRAPRSSAPDVLPPQQEPDRPGGSLWPTVIAGAVVGLGVGLLLSAVIR